MIPKHEAFIDLEYTLADRLKASWGKRWVPLAKRITYALKRNDFIKAHELVTEIDLTPIAKKHRVLAKTIGIAAMMLGRSRATKSLEDTSLNEDEVAVLTAQLEFFDTLLSRNGTNTVRQKAHALVEKIRGLKGESIQKADAAKKITGKSKVPQLPGKVKTDYPEPPYYISEENVAVSYLAGNVPHFDVERSKAIERNFGVTINIAGEQHIAYASSLHVSRLNNFENLLWEYETLGGTQYVVSEVLDDRICPVCIEMDGRVYDMQDGLRQAMLIMQTTDPDAMELVAPWPKQNKESVKRLRYMTNENMVDAGLHLPPYHPRCRGIVTAVGNYDEVDVMRITSEVVAQRRLDDGLGVSRLKDEAYFRSLEAEYNKTNKYVAPAFNSVSSIDDEVMYKAVLEGSKTIENIEMITQSTSAYDPFGARIGLTPHSSYMDFGRARATVRHEFGHHLDAQIGKLFFTDNNWYAPYQWGEFTSFPSFEFLKNAGVMWEDKDGKYTNWTGLIGKLYGVAGDADIKWAEVSKWNPTETEKYIAKQLKKVGMVLETIIDASKPFGYRGPMEGNPYVGDLTSKIIEKLTDKHRNEVVQFATRLAVAIDTGDVSSALAEAGMMINDGFEVWDNFADFFGALTKNQIGYGHETAYYRDLGNYAGVEKQATEMFANYVAMRGARNPVAYKLTRYFGREATGVFDEMIELHNLLSELEYMNYDVKVALITEGVDEAIKLTSQGSPERERILKIVDLLEKLGTKRKFGGV